MADDWISKLTSSIYDAQQNRSNFIGGAEGRALQRLKNIELTIHKAFEGVDYNDENLVEQGFVFQRMSTGVTCGCGESFTPLGSNKSLGW